MPKKKDLRKKERKKRVAFRFAIHARVDTAASGRLSEGKEETC